MRNKASFLVTLEVPDGSSKKELREYIATAVETWRGSLDRESNPIFYLDARKVKVSHFVKDKPKRTFSADTYVRLGSVNPE